MTNLARNEDTLVWSLPEFAARLEADARARGGSGGGASGSGDSGGSGVWARLWREMRSRAALSLAAALPSLHAAHAWLRPGADNYGFQMVGLDFLIDQDLTPWLLEFNSAPSIMAAHSEPRLRDLIRGAKGAMLRDVVAMVAHRLDAGGGGGGSGASSGGGGVSAAAEAGGGGGADAAAAQRPRPRPRAGAGGGAGSGAQWRRDAEAEMAARGGFEPLMGAFPYDDARVPWTDADRELCALAAARGWPWGP